MPALDLVTAELKLTGRITTASNATFLGNIGDVMVVYKPIAGESPLWDFPHGTLAHREVAAYLVSQAFGWDVVPHTWLRDGPMGEGMVQLWQEQDPDQSAVDLIATDQVPESGWKHVLQGRDGNGQLVTLVHEDSPALRHMAVFDVVVNNADRKGDHILAMPDGHRHGVDHGLTFHRDHKLRTVLWGWLGDALTAEERESIDRVSEGLRGGLGRDLADLLSAEEIASLAARCAQLRRAGQFPSPSGGMPAVPWPLF
ncbi:MULTISPECIES: SCO1664 family protein [unclassified Arthrobacter]|uniref:SCO1664 family protein n=1 Tax=unclassified Arthrobacter TaxID=235627 RepID=UPI00159D0D39|nr:MULTISPECIES: SCO1664 family protein [unclassified Arthrobacter]MCQ9165855.1 SCO1664 family protein [Arthrobacter sp. STN4]NVM99710.1 SCO1664 family protein [Arthrobacter sp. SDTb3-6]